LGIAILACREDDEGKSDLRTVRLGNAAQFVCLGPSPTASDNNQSQDVGSAVMSLDYVLSAIGDAVKDGIERDAVYFQSSSCHCRAEMSQERELILIVCSDDVDRFLRLLLLGLLHEDDYDGSAARRSAGQEPKVASSQPATEKKSRHI
jgi:hypothetical protein